MTNEPEGTFLAALVAALQNAATANPGDQTRPAAVLWPDEARQWESLAPDLRAALPAFLTLGAYNAAAGTGPAIWLRAILARALPEAEGWPEDAVPILYLPSVGKNDLRAVESCPRELQPLAELQYRGGLWVQRANSKDWTIEAFLTSARGGLDIKVQEDRATREALRNALPALARQSVAALRKEAPIRAAYLNHLLNPDLIHSLLRWMSDPEGERAVMDTARWTAFRSICREGYGFDPEAEGALTAAAKLGERNGDWETVWNRYTQAAAHYPHIPDRLRSAPQPKQGTLFYRPECWPQENDAREAALRAALLALPTGDPVAARTGVAALEAEHGVRRAWVWATLGQAPLAHALDALSRLAIATGQPLKGGSVGPVVDAYIGGAWKADAAALDALASVGDTADVEAVKHVVDALYRVWLRDGAETFQQAVRQDDAGYICPVPSAEPTPGCCILFADGLRFDVGQRLADTLAARGLTAAVAPCLAALPTVTPTAKPAASPIAHLLGPGAGFTPTVVETGKALNITTFRQLLVANGFQVLQGDATGDPEGAAWTEFGNLDSYGHSQGWKLARRVVEEVRELADRVVALVATGWSEVRIVTDHGWLLLPGGFGDRIEMPVGQVEDRKGRCARLKPDAPTDQQVVPWRWDGTVRIAVAPGISCYELGEEYQHGGLSPQECITPVVTVTTGAQIAPAVTIAQVRWTRQRCRVTLAGTTAGCSVDIRTKPADPATSVAEGGKGVNADGTASLIAPDEDLYETAAHIVVLGARGNVLAQTLTTIGKE